MDLRTISQLIIINTEFYKVNAESFSSTRTRPWAGWVKMTDILESEWQDCLKKKRKMRILDLAAGNLRFEKYLANVLPPKRLSAVAIDNCDLLLPDTVAELSFITHKKQNIIESLLLEDKSELGIFGIAANFDITVSFGFMHHIPYKPLRHYFVKQLVKSTMIGGHIIISLWNFTNTPKDLQNAQDSTKRFFERIANPAGMDWWESSNSRFFEENGVKELEAEDYFLGWQQTDTFRYCHNFTDSEVDEIIEEVMPTAELVACYKADGKNNDQNHYLIFRRVKNAK